MSLYFFMKKFMKIKEKSQNMYTFLGFYFQFALAINVFTVYNGLKVVNKG